MTTLTVTDDHMMTIADAAKYSKCSKSTIRRWIDAGLLPATKIGHICRILKSDLINLLKANQK
jgi:excisionase family DNA binding protein